MIDFVRTVWPTVANSDLIGLVLFLYGCAIIAFGCLYYRMYRRQPDLFFVQSHIERSHVKRVVAAERARLRQIQSEIQGLTEAEAALASGSVNQIPGMLPSGRTLDGRGYTGMLPDGHADDGVWLEVRRPDGTVAVRLDQYVYEELTPEFALHWIRKEVAQHRLDEKRLEVRVRANRSSKASLGRWDFIYFSGVTQTTVGYGDILPNCTAVRQLVLLQIVIGYALLAGLLNVVLTDVGSQHTAQEALGAGLQLNRRR